MPSLDEACHALAGAIATVDGLRAKGYADDQVNPDEAQVYTVAYDPRMVFGKGADYGKSTYIMGVRLYVSRQVPRAAQKRLRGYMETTGATSVLAAIEDGENWDEDIDYAAVVQIGQPFEAAIETEGGLAVTYWALDLDVEVCF